MVYEDFVPERLAKLRMQKGVSARDMSDRKSTRLNSSHD